MRGVLVVFIFLVSQCCLLTSGSECDSLGEAQCYDATCGLELNIPRKTEYSDCECTEENIGHSFTDCPTLNSRFSHEIGYFWKPPATCSGGNLTLPQPIKAIPCDLTCDAGYFVNSTKLATHDFDVKDSKALCEACPPGTYSTGGGLYWDVWPHLPPQFSTSCNVLNHTHTCSRWRTLGDYLDSGVNENEGTTSTLQLHVYLALQGAITFTYKVSYATHNGLAFYVDDTLIFHSTMEQSLNISYLFNPWKNFSHPLQSGYHSFRWVYVKQEQEGEDRATIDNIRVTGTSYFSLSCLPCPSGHYSNTSGSPQCSECSEGYMSNSTSASTFCLECPEGTYSLPGSATCQHRSACTVYEFSTWDGQCQNGLQLLHTDWIQPQVCDSLANGSVNLPYPYKAGCDATTCSPGEYWKSTGGCSPCPEGWYSTGGNNATCKQCEVGHKPTSPRFVIDTWASWKDLGMITDCQPEHLCVEGKGMEGGWRLAHTYIDSGYGHAVGSVSSVEMSVVVRQNNLRTPATLDVKVRMMCTAGSTFIIERNGDQIYAEQCDSSVCALIDSNYSTTQIDNFKWISGLTLVAGFNSVKFLFEKNSYVNGSLFHCDRVAIHETVIHGITYNKGISSGCEACTPGSFLNIIGIPECQLCTPGHYTPYFGSVSCTKCPDNQISELGWEECKSCGVGTTLDGTRSTCSFNCKDLGPFGHKADHFNLTRLIGDKMYGPVSIPLTSTSEPNDTDSVQIYFNLCSRKDAEGVCVEHEGEDQTHFGCVKYSNGTVQRLGQMIEIEWLGGLIGDGDAKQGNSNNQRTRTALEDGIRLTYQYGDYYSSRCKLIVDLICAQHLRESDPYVNQTFQIVGSRFSEHSPQCVMHLRMPSQHACRLCTEDDYEHYTSSCKDGYQTKGWLKKSYQGLGEKRSMCYGGHSVPVEQSIKCTTHLASLDIILIVLAVVMVIILIAVIGFLGFFFRRASMFESKYQMLLQTTGDEELQTGSGSNSVLEETEEGNDFGKQEEEEEETRGEGEQI